MEGEGRRRDAAGSGNGFGVYEVVAVAHSSAYLSDLLSLTGSLCLTPPFSMFLLCVMSSPFAFVHVTIRCGTGFAGTSISRNTGIIPQPWRSPSR